MMNILMTTGLCVDYTQTTDMTNLDITYMLIYTYRTLY